MESALGASVPSIAPSYDVLIALCLSRSVDDPECLLMLRSRIVDASVANYSVSRRAHGVLVMRVCIIVL
jgi:hypothetical protein